MKKTYPTSQKSRGAFGYCKHLRRSGKRMANGSTRQRFKRQDRLAND